MAETERRQPHPALLFDQWPLEDREAWSAATRAKGFLVPGGRGAAWRAASRRSAIGAYGRWLAWLITDQRLDLSDARSHERLTAERLEAYATFLLQGRSSVTAASAFGVLCMAVIAMFPDREWDQLRGMQKELHRRATPMREKRLAPAHVLSELGMDLLEAAADVLDGADRARLPARQVHAAARDFRDGLIIALLASRPLRIKNLAEIEIGTHLRQTSTRTTLEFIAAETKTHVAICEQWPETLLPPLARYLTEIRPLLIAAPATGGNQRRLSEPGARLWVGQGGTHLSAAGINLALRRHAERALGFAMSAHRFRDSVATSIANDDPTKATYAARMLGHKRLSTTERHYIAQDNAAALASYHDHICSLRATLPGSTRSRRAARGRRHA